MIISTHFEVRILNGACLIAVCSKENKNVTVWSSTPVYVMPSSFLVFSLSFSIVATSWRARKECLVVSGGKQKHTFCQYMSPSSSIYSECNIYKVEIGQKRIQPN